jgi:hypothetical protein
MSQAYLQNVLCRPSQGVHELAWLEHACGIHPSVICKRELECMWKKTWIFPPCAPCFVHARKTNTAHAYTQVREYAWHGCSVTSGQRGMGRQWQEGEGLQQRDPPAADSVGHPRRLAGNTYMCACMYEYESVCMPAKSSCADS